MSHFSKIQTTLKETHLLIQAMQDLGWSVECSPEGTTMPFQTGFGEEQAHIVCRHPGLTSIGPTAIGWLRNAEGNYELVADPWELRRFLELPYSSTDEAVMQQLISSVAAEYMRGLIEAKYPKEQYSLFPLRTANGGYRIVITAKKRQGGTAQSIQADINGSTVEVEVTGTTGKQCLTLTRALEAAGTVDVRHCKPEFHQETADCFVYQH